MLDVKVNGEGVAEPIEYVPASEAGPWYVTFDFDSVSGDLAYTLANSGELATVVISIDDAQGVPEVLTGQARVTTGERFILVGRTDLVPVE